MALFPQDKRTRDGREQESHLSRWPVFAAALLIAALFGLLSGVVKDVQFPRGILSADRTSDAPNLTKREPLRALAATDRKDATGAHWHTGGGALEASAVEISFPIFVPAFASKPSSGSAESPFWHGSLPRAPPARA
ncbi:hypothetical protein J2T08_003415 [Neorhizobium galegae]|uniref:hypothetical protein n=1 Tax=Neorhizobium galegae TaxID=399 RepID=UPI001AE5C8C3|nr:hypothetical protein [Neorhizobium galegae]MBP2558926.1 hypothetical protein [Neorhizobium galegae]MDQ0135494.1 hypothetical protein [Neorhizobium galegae]